MFERLSNSWELVKASASVLRADKELIVFPLLSSVALGAVTLSFALPVLRAHDGRFTLHGPSGYILGFLFYLAAYFIILFFNSALVGAALIRIQGGDPTLGDGFSVAFKNLGAIFGYALISATVGMVLHSIQERAGFIGRLVVGLIGMAWGLATFLVVPVMVTEGLGPVESVKRSVELLKSTWGEQIIGEFAVGTITGLVGFVMALLFLPIFLSATGPGLIAAVVAAVAAFLLLSLVSAALSGIYTAALYSYAADGDVSDAFPSELVVSAFRPKD